MTTKLIQYYDEGWRTGTLVRRGYKWTRIERVLPLGMKPKARGKHGQYITVATSDTREVSQ